jgi:hypothetical protein
MSAESSWPYPYDRGYDRVVRGAYRLACVWACLAAAACGPESGEEPVDCERDVTVPILRVGSDEVVVPYGRMEESWMFVVLTYPGDAREMWTSNAGWSDPLSYRVVASDGCDAESRTLANGLDELEPAPRADLPWVARSGRDDGDAGLWLLDPMRNGAAHRVQDHWPWQHPWIDGALWMLEGSGDPPYDLVRVEIDADGEASKNLVRSGVHGIASAVGPEVVRSVIAVESDGVVIVLDAQSGEELWRRDAPYGADVFDADARVLLVVEETEAFVVDRIAGVEIRLERSPVTVFESEPGAVWRPLVENGEEFTRMVLIPEMLERRLPGRWSCTDACDADAPARVLQGPDGLYLLGDPMAEPLRLRGGEGDASIVDDHVELRMYEPSMDPDASALEWEHREAAHAFDGSAIVDDRFGRAVLDSIALIDDRWAYVRESDDAFGELVFFDGRTEAHVPIADDVFPLLDAWRGASTLPWSERRSEFIYVTYEDDETTVWLAHADRLR